MTQIIQVYLLGRFEVVVRGRALPENAWHRRKARQLLKCLLSRPRRRLTKDEAVELLWPESHPEAAATTLRSTVHALRHTLEPSGETGLSALVTVTRDTIGLSSDDAIWADADAFERAVARARDAPDPLPLLEEADALYVGDYLPDDLYEDWAAERRETLKRSWADLQVLLAHHREQRGAPDAAAAALQRLLRADPCDEQAAQQSMRLSLRQGRRSEAMRVYRRLVQSLHDELGVEPAEATVALGRQVSAGQLAEPATEMIPSAVTEVEGRATPPEQEVMQANITRHDAQAGGSSEDSEGRPMACPACGAEHPSRARFCDRCGATLTTGCPDCGHENRSASRFCAGCGHALGGAAQEPRFVALQRDTPTHLVERILVSRDALEGERKHVTVLFADVQSSFELLANRDPEEARMLLAPVLEGMIEAVHRYEGTVSLSLGDGIMALFGAPLAHEDHALRACYAALRMQQTVSGYADRIRRSQGLSVEIRVGLNSGEVVVGAIGNDLRMDYTAIGHTVHLAARMEQIAATGSVLVTRETVRLVEGLMQVNSLGPVTVRGLPEPIEVFELVGVGTARGRLEASAGRGLTRFVGRQTELESLRRAMEHVDTGRGQIVALVGEPGVGKSRLFWELTHSSWTQGWLELEGGSTSHGRATSYRPVIDLFRSYFQIQTPDDERTIREKVASKLLSLDPTLEQTLPAFLWLIDVPVDDPEWQRLDPAQRRQDALNACKRVLLRESRDRPVLLVFEDLHWIDPETQALLDSLVESLPTARILLLANYRPEYRHGWGHKTYYSQVRIDSLSAESAEELLEQLLGADPSLQSLEQVLIERTQGNPFFLEESVRTLAESGALTGDRGAYHLAGAVTGLQVPATVQAVLAARIDRLPPDDKRLLQAAAVIGQDVPLALLGGIADAPEEALGRSLGRLQAAELLYEKSLFPDPEYTFKHTLTHEVAYASLLHERRRALHARIVETIESLWPNRLADQIERLALHAFRGESWDRAVHYLREAGVRAVARSAQRAAVGYLEQALAALEHLPESRATLEQAIDLRFDLRTSLLPLGEIERILDVLHEAEALAEALGDERRLGRLSSYMAAHFWQVGENIRAIEAGERALGIATKLGDPALEVATNQHLGQVYFALGDYRRAVEVLRRNLTSLEGDLGRERLGIAGLPPVSIRNALIWCLAELGEFEEAVTEGAEAVRIAEAAGHRFSVVYASYRVGGVHLRRGDLDRAIPLLERAHELCQAWSFPALLPWTEAVLGHAYALDGRVAAALPLLEQAIEHAASIQFTTLQSLWLTWLSEAYLLAGRHAEADHLAQRALDVARDRQERGNEAHANAQLGAVASGADPPDSEQAEARYRHAVGLADELGMRPLLAQCHLGLGRLYRRIGRSEQARSELSAAGELFRSMQLATASQRAETELAGIPH